MRKTNVFGKKVSQIKVVYFIVIIFAIVFAARVYILNLQENRLLQYQEQEEELNDLINDIIFTQSNTTYHLIGEIIQYLPNTYTPQQVSDEIEFVMNLSDLALSTDVDITQTLQPTTPFGNQVPSSIKAVKIALSFTTDLPANVLDFIDYLYDQDRIYTIESVNVDIDITGVADVNFVIYTYYNDVNVS